MLTPEKIKGTRRPATGPAALPVSRVPALDTRVARTTEPAHELHAHRETTRGEMQLPYQRAVFAGVRDTPSAA